MEPKEKTSTEVAENAKGIEDQKKIDLQLEAAAKKYHETVKYQQAENQYEAYGCSIQTNSHMALATEAQIETLKHAIFTS